MNNAHYIFQVVLCLLTVAGIFLALVKTHWRRSRRMCLLLCPLSYGGIYHLLTGEPSGVYAMLMCVLAMLIVVFRIDKSTDEQQ
ncbi:MAG: hypothetical protein IJV08_06535 [Bacteroidaceae bacterium]|nr:hypothetical protein [Bacteroidaceae bacterium]